MGQPVRRVEDRRFITGAGRFTDDIDLPGQAFAVLVRSSQAHARIGRVSTAAAKAAPGVFGVFTAEDLAADGIGTLPCKYVTTNRDGSPMALPPRPVLAQGHATAYGQVLADELGVDLEKIELLQGDTDVVGWGAGPAARGRF